MLKKIRYLAFFCLLTLYSIAQQKTITGKVTGNTGQPLNGASIREKGTNKTTITNEDGSFSFSVSGPNARLIVSYIGYITKDILVADLADSNIMLIPSVSNLNDVIVIGYGTTRRKDVTGAVAKIGLKEFNPAVFTNPMAQIQGKIAGVVITQPGGDPNGEFTVRVRGATSLEGQSPLVVIDGVAIDDFNKALATINPGDIESFDILKDASAAAIYGSRGANGIVLITTKSSQSGKVVVEYNGFTGMEKISNELDMLSASEWRKATVNMNAGDLDAGADMDWQKAISRTAFSHSHTIGISGGSSSAKFHGSVGYLNQEGVIIHTGKEAVTARFTGTLNSFNNKLEIRLGMNASTVNRDFLPDQNSTNQSRLGGSTIFSNFGALGYLPVWPAYKADGTYFLSPSNLVNPLFFLNENYNKQRENFFQGSFKADYEILKGIQVGVLGALSRGNDVYDNFLPVIPGGGGTANASKNNYNKQNFSGDIHGHYNKRFARHTIDFTGVYEFNRFVNDSFGVTANGFLVPELLNNNLGAAISIQPGSLFSYKNEVKLISFLGRAGYNFDHRFIFTTNFRWDGSSKFGRNNRWGFFPSLALAWRISNEHFLKNVAWINNLKLRVSYGFTGNQENLPPDTYQTLYGPAGLYLYDGNFYQSYAVNQENNPDLKWEVRKSLNVGIDFSVLGDRINGTIDIFNDHTDDMLFLYGIPQPPFLTNQVYANAASATNKGVEITVGSKLVKKKNFTWEVQANLATLKNRVTKLLGKFKGFDLTISDPSYGYAYGGALGNTAVTRVKVNYPAGVFWLPQHAGFDPDGHELFNNYDQDGKVIGTSPSFSDQDRLYTDPTPHFTWGITNKFKLGNFDLNFLIRGVQGQKIFANTLYNLENSTLLPGRNVTRKALANGFKELSQASDYWLKDGSFARMENITIGYSFEKIKGISSLRFYGTATNLFVITNYEGVDPEVRTEGNERYIDFNYYPKTREVILGVNVAF